MCSVLARLKSLLLVSMLLKVQKHLTRELCGLKIVVEILCNTIILLPLYILKVKSTVNTLFLPLL